jgi:hypothetical protein
VLDGAGEHRRHTPGGGRAHPALREAIAAAPGARSRGDVTRPSSPRSRSSVWSWSVAVGVPKRRSSIDCSGGVPRRLRHRRRAGPRLRLAASSGVTASVRDLNNAALAVAKGER